MVACRRLRSKGGGLSSPGRDGCWRTGSCATCWAEPAQAAVRVLPVTGASTPGSTNDHDLGLFEVGPAAAPSGAGRTTVGLYHLAWELDTLGELEQTATRLSQAGALVGASDHGTTKSLYGKDPNGIEFEIVWIIPADLLDD